MLYARQPPPPTTATAAIDICMPLGAVCVLRAFYRQVHACKSIFAALWEHATEFALWAYWSQVPRVAA